MFRLCIAEEDQHQDADPGIHAQDVARPKQDAVQGAENQQDEQAAQVDGEEFCPFGFCTAHLHRHAPAKQEGKERVELCLDEEIDQRNDGAVERFCPIVEIHGLPGKTAHVKEQDSEDGEAAQDVNDLDAFFGLDGDGFCCAHNFSDFYPLICVD